MIHPSPLVSWRRFFGGLLAFQLITNTAFPALAAAAQELTWEALKTSLSQSSLTLQKENMDIAIAQQEVKEARAEYIPQVTFNANSEYLDNLNPQPNQAGASTVVGDTFIVNQSAWQNSAVLGAQITLVDFGRRKAGVKRSQAKTRAESADYSARQKEVFLQVLPLFASGWELQRQKALYENQLTLQKQKYDTLQRLYKAGEIGKVPVYEQALTMLDIQQTIEDVDRKLVKNMQSIEQYTFAPLGQNGEMPQLVLPAPPKEGEVLALQDQEAPNFEDDPMLQKIKAETEQKNWELYKTKRDRWAPTLSAYGRLIAFGADPNNPGEAFSDYDLVNSRVGLSLQVPISQTVALKAREDRIEMELDRLKLAQEEARQKLAMEWQHNMERLKAMPQRESLAEETVAQADELESATKRLREQKVASALDALNAQIRANTVKLNAIRNQAERWMLTERQRIISPLAEAAPSTEDARIDDAPALQEG